MWLLALWAYVNLVGIYHFLLHVVIDAAGRIPYRMFLSCLLVWFLEWFRDGMQFDLFIETVHTHSTHA
jgi:hypothetical protein